MKRVLLLALLVVAGCPGKSSPTASAPELPGPRVGQVYVFRLLYGATREDEVTAVSPTSVSIARTASLPGSIPTGSTASVTSAEEPLAGPSPSAAIPPGAEYESAGKETLVVSGESFPCEVRQLKADAKVREWVSARWPHVIRTRSGPFVTLELQQILPKREEK